MRVDDGGGGGVEMPASNIKSSMDDFKNAALSGGFSVNESGGQALISAIDDLLEWINGSALDMTQLSREPKLGGSSGGKVMSPFVQKVATDHEGFTTVLQELRESLNTAKQGINAAMANYQENDAVGARKLKG